MQHDSNFHLQVFVAAMCLHNAVVSSYMSKFPLLSDSMTVEYRPILLALARSALLAVAIVASASPPTPPTPPPPPQPGSHIVQVPDAARAGHGRRESYWDWMGDSVETRIDPIHNYDSRSVSSIVVANRESANEHSRTTAR